jgi:hypothetical protein
VDALVHVSRELEISSREGGFSLGCPHIIFFFDAKYLEILPVNIIFK